MMQRQANGRRTDFETDGRFMQIRGIDGMSLRDVQTELQRGGRFVHFEWCVSVIFVTFRRPTDIYFLRGGQNGWWQSLPYTLLSLVLGWWGIPFGLIYTPMAIFTNLSGGRDVSGQVLSFLAAVETSQRLPP